MSEWTREQRYQGIDDVPQSQLIELKQKVDASHYRQTYHIQPETGLLNDPNGLIFYNGTYYVSHQWFPLGAVHGLKYWFNYTSKDLVSFTPHGPILEPDTAYVVMVYIVEVLLNTTVNFTICIPEIIEIQSGIDTLAKC